MELGATIQTDLFTAGIDERFRKFHADNPRIYTEFLKLAERARADRRLRIGAKFLLELVRWNRNIQTTGEDFKINNSFVSRYVRLLAQERPDLAGMFETRKLKAV